VIVNCIGIIVHSLPGMEAQVTISPAVAHFETTSVAVELSV
jgi:hypothetical protein